MKFTQDLESMSLIMSSMWKSLIVCVELAYLRGGVVPKYQNRKKLVKIG